MNIVASTEDKFTHFRVPVSLLMSKVDACFQQVTHVDLSHDVSNLYGLGFHTSQIATRRHPQPVSMCVLI